MSDAESESLSLSSEEEVAEVEYSYSTSSSEEESNEDGEHHEKPETSELCGHSIEIRITAPNDRKSSHIISAFERESLISLRLAQIAQYNNCMVPTDDLDKARHMAIRELDERRFPLCIKRPMGTIEEGGKLYQVFEEWDPNTMHH